MRQLTIKELAPYLPYGLKYKGEYGGVSKLRKLEYCRPYDKESGEFRDEIGVDGYLIQYIKPILHPLSDLTKEIEHNGEKFVPSEWLEDKYYTLDFGFQCERLLEEDGENWINQSDYMLVQHLFEWHFDVFGLIEQGLAIDINTLNP